MVIIAIEKCLIAYASTDLIKYKGFKKAYSSLNR